MFLPYSSQILHSAFLFPFPYMSMLLIESIRGGFLMIILLCPLFPYAQWLIQNVDIIGDKYKICMV